METLTIQRRTIELPKGKVKCKIKWTDRERIPRKLKKKYKKRGLLNPMLVKLPQIRRMLEYENRKSLTELLTNNSRANKNIILEYGK